MKSVHAIILISFIWVIAGAFYYPKWNKSGSEAAISWDVSGYYHYLPGLFIYKDLHKQEWINNINEKYLPSPAYDQAYVHTNSGNKVNKYAIGQAVLFSPFFLTAHIYTNFSSTFLSDGYSKPYQFSIWLGGFLISVLGLFLLRKLLLYYFNDESVLWILLALGIGTHWLEYAAISNGMNHTWLFTILCALILFSRKFHTEYDWYSAAGIGLTLGLAILTRPTEIMWVLVPLLWNIQSIKDRLNTLFTHWKKCLAAVVICSAIISIQLVYWKYATGEWIVYSYGEQKFNWLRVPVARGLFGPNIGWWVYTPMMLISMFGFIRLYRIHRSIFWPTLLTAFGAIYITLSWGHWEEGGGLGHRNMIQMYPLLAFPLACVITWFTKTTMGRLIWIVLLGLNIYYSFWWVHQAHKGGFFQPGQMTKSYFFNVAGRLNPDPDLRKLLDTDEYFWGIPQVVNIVYENNFENDSLKCEFILSDSSVVACLNKDVQFYIVPQIILPPSCNEWIRFEGDFTVRTREWSVWNYTQWIVQFYNGDAVVKSSMIRLQRHIVADNTPTHIFFDVKIPDAEYDRCVMNFWNADSENTILIDNLKASCYIK